MTTPANPVTTVPGFSLAGQAGAAGETTLLYTVSTTSPERIETVALELDYGSGEPTFDVFSLQLLDAAQNVLYEQATPDITATDGSTLVVKLVWSRLGNDSAQEKLFIHDDGASGFSLGWANMRLPDLVLASQSQVVLRSWTNETGELPPIDISTATVTVTRDAGDASTTTIADITPFLLPTNNN